MSESAADVNIVRLIVALIVTLIWAAAWTVAIVTHDYNGIGAITPVMLAVVGYLFAREWISLRHNGRSGNGK